MCISIASDGIQFPKHKPPQLSHQFAHCLIQQSKNLPMYPSSSIRGGVRNTGQSRWAAVVSNTIPPVPQPAWRSVMLFCCPPKSESLKYSCS